MDKSFYTIYKTFFKVGTMLLGGGYVILPLLQAELVEKKTLVLPDIQRIKATCKIVPYKI